ELEVFVVKIGRRYAVLAHRLLYAFQKSLRAAEADTHSSGPRFLHDLLETSFELWAHRTVRHRNELRTARMRELAYKIRTREFPTRREEVKQRDALERAAAFVLEPRDEGRDTDAPRNPDFASPLAVSTEPAERCIHRRMHAGRRVLDEPARVVAELPNDEVHVARFVRGVRDRERVGLA